MTDKRIYIFVPQTVQVETPLDEAFSSEGQYVYSSSGTAKFIRTVKMEPGRLMAQCNHIGRKFEHYYSCDGSNYEEITTIVLSVRNSKELSKITDALRKVMSRTKSAVFVTFEDENPQFYKTEKRVHTVTAVGPVDSESLAEVIDHLELYQ